MQQFDHWSIDRFIDYARNPRKNDHAVDSIASAIKEFGFRVPVVVQSDGTVVDGHLRLKAARKLGIDEIPVLLADDMTDAQIKAFRLSVNKMAELADWNTELLSLELEELQGMDFDLDLTGFDADFILPEETEGLTDEDAVPEAPEEPVTVEGDIWVLGDHRVMCGDSTSIDAVEKLMGGELSILLHADPPYGMGKEKDGVLNDNLYRDKLDAFQMEWIKAFRLYMADNASVYIWGNAEDLWRLWYVGGLKDSERLTFRNEIIWEKGAFGSGGGTGVGQAIQRSYFPATERCLFFMLGEQGFNNNADNYFEGWDSVVNYLDNEKTKAGLTIKVCKRLAGHSEKSGCHWFDKSQWSFPTEDVYNSWKTHCQQNNIDAFKKEYNELKKEYSELKKEFYATRAYFDNTHENMTDVWNYQRVTGEDRHGHATPKPVDMMERIMKSSAPENSIVVEPFLGSGSTLIACEKTNRKCYGMELDPKYCDVIINRWQDFTGKSAILERTGQSFNEIKEVKPELHVVNS